MTITTEDVIKYIHKTRTQTVEKEGELGKWMTKDIFKDPEVQKFVLLHSIIGAESMITNPVSTVGSLLLTGIIMGVEICKEKIEEKELEKLNV